MEPSILVFLWMTFTTPGHPPLRLREPQVSLQACLDEVKKFLEHVDHSRYQANNKELLDGAKAEAGCRVEIPPVKEG